VNPFLVACPDCLAPAGTRCYISTQRIPNEDGMAVHASRRDSARLRVAVHGTCQLCSHLMIQLTEPDETRHPALELDGSPIPPCPPYPQPGEGPVNWTGSGAEQFVRNEHQPDPPEDQPMPPPPHPPQALPSAASDPMADPPGSTVL
jgi:hypothetical protein